MRAATALVFLLAVALAAAAAASGACAAGRGRACAAASGAQDHALLQMSLGDRGPLAADQCGVPENARSDCGHFGISKAACEDKGCCWRPHIDAGSRAPVCFHAAAQAGRPEAAPCSSTVQGEQCFAAIQWAMNHGIVEHPEWYPDTLGVSSSLQDFQAHFHQSGQAGCVAPCESCHKVLPGETCHDVVDWAKYNGIRSYPNLFPGLTVGSTLEEFQHLVRGNNKIAFIKDPPILGNGDQCQAYMAITGCDWTAERSCPGQQPAGSAGVAADDNSTGYECCCRRRLWKPICPEACNLCRTAERGDRCFADVQWAMEVGMRDHPEWYPNLTATSSAKEFQVHLQRMRQPCPAPCGMCSTAEKGSRCYDGVMWAMEHGVKIYPHWYPELSAESPFAAFQAHLHTGGYEGCPMPCQ